MTRDEIYVRFKCKSYRAWSDVPDYLMTRTALKKIGISFNENAKPDAIKNSSSTASRDKIYFLFDVRKFIAI